MTNETEPKMTLEEILNHLVYDHMDMSKVKGKIAITIKDTIDVAKQQILAWAKEKALLCTEKAFKDSLKDGSKDNDVGVAFMVKRVENNINKEFSEKETKNEKH